MTSDERTMLVLGSRLLCGWACAAVAVLNLTMGRDGSDGGYLLFHLVLLAGGLLLLFQGTLRRTSRPMAYVVTLALAFAVTVVAALPSTSSTCCLRTLEIRHGYPLTVLAWNRGSAHHFAPAHFVADVVFWYLVGLLLLALLTQFVPALSTPSSAASSSAASSSAASSSAASSSAAAPGAPKPTASAPPVPEATASASPALGGATSAPSPPGATTPAPSTSGAATSASSAPGAAP